MLETAKHSLTRPYQFHWIGIPVRNLQNYGFHYGFLNLRILGSVCSRTKKEKKKKSVGRPADSLCTRTRLLRFVHRTGAESARRICRPDQAYTMPLVPHDAPVPEWSPGGSYGHPRLLSYLFALWPVHLVPDDGSHCGDGRLTSVCYSHVVGQSVTVLGDRGDLYQAAPSGPIGVGRDATLRTSTASARCPLEVYPATGVAGPIVRPASPLSRINRRRSMESDRYSGINGERRARPMR